MKQKLKIKKKTMVRTNCPENSAKPFVIDRHWVWEAYKAVKRNKGCAGVDKIDFKRFDKRFQDNLYRRERGMFAHWSLGYQPQCAT